MIITLTKIADQLAGDMNRSNDHKLKARLKDLIAQEYATIIKQTVDKNGYSQSLISSIYIPLKKVVSSPLEVTRKKIVYITSVKVKQPLRTLLSPQSFSFVGSYDGVSSFIPSSFEAMKHVLHLPLISQSIYYIYQNSFIYVISPTPIKTVKVSAIFSDIQDVYEEVQQNPNTVFNILSPQVKLVTDTNIELDIPLDIINLIKYKLLNEELKLQESIQPKQLISDVDNN